MRRLAGSGDMGGARTALALARAEITPPVSWSSSSKRDRPGVWREISTDRREESAASRDAPDMGVCGGVAGRPWVPEMRCSAVAMSGAMQASHLPPFFWRCFICAIDAGKGAHIV